MNSLRETAVVALLLLLGASLVPAYAQQAEPAEEEEPSDLWSQVQALYEKAKSAGEEVPGTTIEWIREDLDKVVRVPLPPEQMVCASVLVDEDSLNYHQQSKYCRKGNN